MKLHITKPLWCICMLRYFIAGNMCTDGTIRFTDLMGCFMRPTRTCPPSHSLSGTHSAWSLLYFLLLSLEISVFRNSYSNYFGGWVFSDYLAWGSSLQSTFHSHMLSIVILIYFSWKTNIFFTLQPPLTRLGGCAGGRIGYPHHRMYMSDKFIIKNKRNSSQMITLFAAAEVGSKEELLPSLSPLHWQITIDPTFIILRVCNRF